MELALSGNGGDGDSAADRLGTLVRRRLEVYVFSYPVAGLRSGDIAVPGSGSYANLHDQLMSWEECGPLVLAFCT